MATGGGVGVAGFVELGRGVQASSSNPFETAGVGFGGETGFEGGDTGEGAFGGGVSILASLFEAEARAEASTDESVPFLSGRPRRVWFLSAPPAPVKRPGAGLEVEVR
jgi:hypothetical protein